MAARYLEVLEVRWVDSTACAEWTPTAELRTRLHEVVTVGLLIHQDAESYFIATSYDAETDSINAAIQIPAVCVRTVKQLAMVAVA